MSSSKFIVIAVSASLVLPLSACATDGTGISNQQIGTVLGTVAGGLIGSQFGGGAGRIAAVLAGSAIGGLVGSYIGNQLDERDRAALETRSATTLASVPDGQSVGWTSDHSGAQAKITPSNTRVETRNMTFVRSAKIESPQQLQPIGETYQAKQASNLRSGPSTQSPIVDGLKVGEAFTAMGSVSNDKWIVVGKNGAAVGYVSAGLVKPATASVANAQLTKAVNLDDITLEDGYVADQVVAKVECRTLDYKIDDPKNGAGTDQFQACRKPDGSWEII